jgi:hypothetical protein
MDTCQSPELPSRAHYPCQQSRPRRGDGTKSRLGTESRVARFGPTTPTRAGRLANASVDVTGALLNDHDQPLALLEDR